MRYLIIVLIFAFLGCNNNNNPTISNKNLKIEEEYKVKSNNLLLRFSVRSKLSNKIIDLKKVEKEFYQLQKKSNKKAYDYIKQKYNIIFPGNNLNK